MADYPDQTPERRDEILRTSPLNARLGGRLSEAIGVIDVKHTQNHHARLMRWMAHRFPLLAHFQTRYNGDEISGAQQSLVMQQAHASQVNPFNESPAHFSAPPAPPPPSFNAATTPTLPSTPTAAPSPASPDETPQGTFRFKRRPPKSSQKYGTAETSGTRPSAAPTESNATGGHISRAVEHASPASQTPPPLVLSPSANNENKDAGARPATTFDAPTKRRDAANVEQVSSATPTPATNAARERNPASDASSNAQARAPEMPTRAPEIARESLAGGPTLSPMPLTKRAGDAATGFDKAKASGMLDSVAPRDARGSVAASGDELLLQRTTASGMPQGDATTAAGRVASSNAIQTATETPAARETKTGFILRDDARGQRETGETQTRGSELLLRAQEATVSRRSETSRNAANAQALAGTASATARQALPLAPSMSPRAASETTQANVPNVAFEIQDGARVASAGGARIVWRKGREGAAPDGFASFETGADISSVSSGASNASSVVNSTAQSQSSAPASVPAEAQNGAANIERITEQVIRTLSRRMSVERERRGLRR